MKKNILSFFAGIILLLNINFAFGEEPVYISNGTQSKLDIAREEREAAARKARLDAATAKEKYDKTPEGQAAIAAQNEAAAKAEAEARGTSDGTETPTTSANPEVADSSSVYCPEDGSQCYDTKTKEDVKTVSSESSNSSGPNDLRSVNFKFNVSNLSPSTKKYTQGGDNVKGLLNSITTLLLIILPTLCVLFMVFGGIMIITSGGASEKVTKGKNIVIYNIVAIVVGLFSYTIIRLVIWILGSTSFS